MRYEMSSGKFERRRTAGRTNTLLEETVR